VEFAELAFLYSLLVWAAHEIVFRGRLPSPLRLLKGVAVSWQALAVWLSSVRKPEDAPFALKLAGSRFARGRLHLNGILFAVNQFAILGGVTFFTWEAPPPSATPPAHLPAKATPPQRDRPEMQPQVIPPSSDESTRRSEPFVDPSPRGYHASTPLPGGSGEVRSSTERAGVFLWGPMVHVAPDAPPFWHTLLVLSTAPLLWILLAVWLVGGPTLTAYHDYFEANSEVPK
jgi:hypothetical protein